MPHQGFAPMLRLLVLVVLAGPCASTGLHFGTRQRLPTQAALAQVELPMPASAEPFMCDVDASGPICMGDQQRILLPVAKPPGLVGFWPFDENLALDVSGSKNHAVTPFVPGPSFGVQGTSAFFRRTYVTIPGVEDTLKLQDYSYTFWLRFTGTGDDDGDVIPNMGLKLCPILRKGLDNPHKSTFAAAPAILIDRQTRKLRVEMATTDQDTGVEAMESNAKLREDMWFHIAVVRLDGQRRTRLYVNGILDASVSTNGYTQPNDEPLYVGGDPLLSGQCDVPMYVDELRVYNRPLTPDEIQAEAAPALNGVEPSFVRLACTSCPLETAMENCPEGYHICNSLELHMGGYHVARTLGWLDAGTHVWSHATVENAALQRQGGLVPPASAPAPSPEPGLMGLGLCCNDLA